MKGLGVGEETAMSGKETAGITPEDAEQETTEGKLDFLKRVLPFRGLGDLELSEIARTMDAKRFPPREVIIQRGVQGKSFYLIRSGLVKVYLLDDEGKEVVLGFLGEGDCFGEISLLTQGPTTAHIQTMEETVTLAQDKEAFLLSNHIDPADLSTRQKQLLKEAFWAVSQLQKTTRSLLNVKGEDEGFRM